MRLLLDEHLPRALAETLRANGHDVVRVVEVGLRTGGDRDLWQWAINEARVIVSYDTSDFSQLYAEFFRDGIQHPGLVIVSSKSMRPDNIGALVRSLERLLEHNPHLTDRLVFLQR